MKFIKPCLILGSGFHSWVLGHPNTALSSWHTLINETAQILKVSQPSQTLPPVFRWERLLQSAIDQGYQTPSDSGRWINANELQASKVEEHAKQAVKKVLDRHQFNYPFQSTKVGLILNGVFGEVVSLNFDHCLINPKNYLHNPGLINHKISELPEREVKRLYCFVKPYDHPLTRLWFPNGSVDDESTIRMGLYDYGSQPNALKAAFKLVKSYEQENKKCNGVIAWEKYLECFEEISLKHRESGIATDYRISHWVAHFLYRPIYLAGVGLSKDESGLWWLLAQRARNHSRLPREHRPKTVILVHADKYDRNFWANRPFGVETLVCENWESGWEELLDKASG